MPSGDAVSFAVARLLAEARRTESLSMEELADRASLHRTYIGLLERGERQPTLAVVANLAEALGVALPELIADAEESVAKGYQPELELVHAPRRRTADRACLRECAFLTEITGLSEETVAM